MTSESGLLHLNGTTISARAEGAGPAVLLVHGFALDQRMWRAQIETLRDSYTVVTFDVRGFGHSAPPGTEPYSHSADCLAVLRHFGFARAHMVGLSMGGRIVLRCAQTNPEAVASLTVLDAAADGMTRSSDWQARWQAIVAAARAGRIDEARRLWLEHPLFAPARAVPQAAAAMAAMVGDYSGWHWTHDDPAEAPRPPVLEKPDVIRVPTLVVCGALDLPDFLAVSEGLARGIPGARRRVVPGAGHMVNLEAPAAVNDALRRFLMDVDCGAAT